MPFESDFTPLSNDRCLADQIIVDAGCGDGWLSREMAKWCQTVIAIEPDAQQAAKNRKVGFPDNVLFHATGAEALPVANNSADGVVLCYSLHHVPHTVMTDALREAHRALKPDGWLYIAEPLPAGNYHCVIEFFHDETHVYHLAQDTLNASAAKLFSQRHTFEYEKVETIESFDDFVNDIAPLTYNDGYTREQVESVAAPARFEEQRNSEVYELITPVKVDVFEDKID